jgi:coenzyme Q-binding protein COQ10
MFDLVADVERYPEFIPHCLALRVVSREVVDGTGRMEADMVVAYRAFRERFRSRVDLDRTRLSIDVDYVEGPFRRLANHWRFRDAPGGSEVDFIIDFEFRNIILQATAAAVFERAFARMSEAFVARAAVVYGARAPSS